MFGPDAASAVVDVTDDLRNQEPKSQHGRVQTLENQVVFGAKQHFKLLIWCAVKKVAHARGLMGYFHVICSLFHEGQLVVCSSAVFLSTYLSLDHQLVRLFHSWGELVDEAAQLEHTERINTACLFTVWIIHDFWTESKQTAGTSARYRRLHYISGSDRENFDELVMWCAHKQQQNGIWCPIHRILMLFYTLHNQNNA